MIPYINTRNPSIPNVGIGGVRNVNVYMANVRDLNIPETRIWMDEPSQSVPIDVPVVVNIGKPIVDMPGCVTVHKENVKNRSKNKMLVNDDPKGNTTLCDSGMPSFQPVDYQSQGLTWTTVVPEEPEPDGVDSEPPPPPPPARLALEILDSTRDCISLNFESISFSIGARSGSSPLSPLSPFNP